MKIRLDQLLVARGLAPTRSQARDLVLRGCVRVGGIEARKAGLEVGDNAAVEVAADAQPYVSRGGLKLAAALDAFSFDASGRTALDVGASTGGFVDVLLKRGAISVFAVDVGHGQLHPSLAADARVVSLEGRDIRQLDRTEIPGPVTAITADVSFVSLTVALEAALAFAAPGAWLVGLVKPQFEVGRGEIGKGGIVRDIEARGRAVTKVRDWLGAAPGWHVAGVIDSPIAGGSGNIEFLIGAVKHG
jgi:23S rRNA (cytidine1920-2'-O)/16S rRNA (cytidine1409-2'-O)-methyltransferase